ncbi:hypothetical protein [Streptomyces sp. NPDC016845]|uniref:hypothetical protein n=1 Tax=Streptomyces sp. NPDC016845 TaxID=3364972 RepID=UPI00379677C1
MTADAAAPMAPRTPDDPEVHALRVLPARQTAPPGTSASAPGGRWGAAFRSLRDGDWLAVVAVLYLLAQLAFVVTQLGHGLGWDESVYVSQYDPRNPTVFFSAPRSRGTSLLTAPLIAVTDSTVVIRIVLAVLSSAALYAAFRVWRPLVGARTTAFAALLFAGLWIAVLSGAMAMPNLWVAFGSVGAVGWFLRADGSGTGGGTGGDTGKARYWWLAGCVAVVALFRAPDAAWLVLPLAVAALLMRERRRTLPYLAAGLVAGLAQWVVEAYVRWGGVAERLRVSSATEGDMGLHLNFGTAWRAVNGPLLCRPCTAGNPAHPELALWFLALPLLTAAAVFVALRGRRPAPILAPVACAAALSVPYLLLIGYSAPRFLLPTYALLSLPVAVLLRRMRRHRALAVAAVALVVLHLGSQFAVLHREVASTARTDARYIAAADGLRALGLTPPCLVTGPRALPVGYAAGCASAQTRGNNESMTRDDLLRRAAEVPTAVLTERGHRPPKYARDWTPYELPHTPGWTAWKAPTPGRP